MNAAASSGVVLIARTRRGFPVRPRTSRGSASSIHNALPAHGRQVQKLPLRDSGILGTDARDAVEGDALADEHAPARHQLDIVHQKRVQHDGAGFGDHPEDRVEGECGQHACGRDAKPCCQQVRGDRLDGDENQHDADAAT